MNEKQPVHTPETHDVVHEDQDQLEVLARRYEVLRETVESRVLDKGFDDLLALYPDAPELPTITDEDTETLDPDDLITKKSAVAQERLALLDGFARTHWDYRKGVERQQQELDAQFDDESSPLWDSVFKATDRFGMVESSHPQYTHYDMLIILGGAGLSPLQRTQYALEQGVEFDSVASLGSDRVLPAAERTKTAGYAPDATTEYDLMNGSVKTAFGLDEKKSLTLTRVGYDHKDESIPRVSYYRTTEGYADEGATSIFVLNAPTRPDRSRANTDDTYQLLREAAGNRLHPDARVLIVTNAYVSAFQEIDAKRNIDLVTGAESETIGFDAAYGGVKRLPSQLLQETKSYISSLVKLQKSLDELEAYVNSFELAP